jgi:hypothetical protein
VTLGHLGVTFPFGVLPSVRSPCIIPSAIAADIRTFRSRKLSERSPQLISGLYSRNQGKPSTSGAVGCNPVIKNSTTCIVPSAKLIESLNALVLSPADVGFTSKSSRGIGSSS